MRQLFVACAAAALLWPTMAGAATPEEMAQQIAGSLRQSGELSNYRVGVKFEDGVAWLLGTVTSTEQSATALRLASNVEGVQHVVNKLEVKAPAVSQTPAVPTANQRNQESAGLLLTTMQETAAPQPLPSNPTAMPAPMARTASRGMPRPMRRGARRPMPQGVQNASYGAGMGGGMGGGMGMGMPPQGQSTAGAAGASYDKPNMPGYAWPSYAGGSNYAALTYPKQYSPSAWPYIGPFYPYPQVPLGWRKVTLEWDDGWWNLDFSHHKNH